MKNFKVAVAMSGGVDSSLAAALCVKEYGKENVFGVTMRLFCYGKGEFREKSCCSMEAINDAKAVCDQLGIAHYAINMEKEFEKAVITDFVSEYKKGHTPIPCIPCNTVIKFDYLLKKVQSLGADFLATGHYARILKKKDGYRLYRGVDKTKDQTYFLYGLNQDNLSKILFPLGGMKKTAVRKLAAKLGLKTAVKKESQGICFVTEGRVTDWLSGRVKNKVGNIVNAQGEVIARHEGIVYYTVGQRKRIGGGFAGPMYVIKIKAKENEVVIGTEKELYGKELSFSNSHWINRGRVGSHCSAKIRYNMDDAPCTVKDDKVIFKTSQRAITPGQSIVFYRGEEVLGGGIITDQQ